MPGLEVSGYSCGVLILWFSWFENLMHTNQKICMGKFFGLIHRILMSQK